MSREEFLYIFSGKVFPERADVNISQLNFIIKNEDAKIEGKVCTSIIASQIMAKFECKNKVENIYTLKNYIEDNIRLQVDILGYLIGCGYDIEITSVVEPSENINKS